ncbi:MAG: hypothetical protein HY401_00810 [Elusimicrobia bacterium]|nr:hypothetical protein [Elusimicrobiota bacterium]
MRALAAFLTFVTLLPHCSFGPISKTSSRVIPKNTNLTPAPPAREIDGLYFKIISNAQTAAEVSKIADMIYRGILADIKLTESFRPYSLMPLYLYQTREEYLQKSGMPEWSGAVFMGNAIVCYEYRGLPQTLAHEISHLIFQEFFAGYRTDLLWLNEGLAMHEEYRARGDAVIREAISASFPILKSSFWPLKDLTQIESALDHREKEARIFYIESWLLVRFLLEKGGRVGFYEMLKALKMKRPLNAAIALGFPGKWNNLQELETSFKTEYSITW